MLKDKKTDFIIIAVLFILVFAFYAYTAAPSVYEGDSGDLTTAVNVMGLPYPTGFPLYIILGKIFVTLVPIGEVDFRMNLFSALFAALSVALMYFVFKNLGIKRFIAIISCLILTFSKTLWSHAGAARVYALNGFIFILLLFLLTQWFRCRQRKYLYLFALFLGVGFGVHVTIIFAAVMFLVVLILTEPKLLINLKFVLKLFMLFLAPFIQYIYLFVAYKRFTIMNFGDLSTVKGFIRYITQKDYAYKIGNQSFGVIKSILDKTFNLFLNEFTWIIFILIVLGIMVFFFQKNKRPLFWGFLAVIIANLLLMVNYGNMNDLVILFRYFLLSYIVFSVFIAFALQFILNICAEKKHLIVISSILLLILPIIPLYANFASNNRHNNNIVKNLATNILDSVEENAFIVSHGDAISGALWYLQSIDMRKDVIVIDAGLLSADWYVKNQNKLYPGIIDLSLLSNPKDERYYFLARNVIDKKPIYFTALPPRIDAEFSVSVYNPLEERLNKLIFVPRGLVYKAFKNQKPSMDLVKTINENLWQKYKLGGVFFKKSYDNEILELINTYSISLNNLGIYYYNNGLTSEAKTAIEKSLEINPDNQSAKEDLEDLF